MKRYTIITLLMLSLVPYFLFSEEQQADFKEYIMPKNLTYTSLPDDYDKRIEDYFQYFYKFMMVQDPNLSRIENGQMITQFIDTLSEDEINKLSFSRWILLNEYYNYYKEYSTINNRYLFNELINSDFANNSLYYAIKRPTNNQHSPLFDEIDFKAKIIDRFCKTDNPKALSMALDRMWIIGKIQSFEIRNIECISHIVVTISVKKQLGGKFSNKKTIKVLIGDILNTYKAVSLSDLKLNTNDTYLFPVTNINVSLDKNNKSFEGIDLICPNYSHTAGIFLVKDNKLNKNNIINKEHDKRVLITSNSKIYDFFFDTDNMDITIKNADKKLKRLFKVKK